MKNFLCVTLLTATLADASFSMLAASVSSVPAPAQGPVVQYPKLANDQVTQIRELHQQLEISTNQIPVKGAKDDALINAIKSGKWNGAVIQKQLSTLSNIEQQVRHYRVKYYFDLNEVLTPGQRQQVQKDIAQTLSE